MTRGMDVAGVENVVNYDAPVYVKTYVHRAGRTARAGEGRAWGFGRYGAWSFSGTARAFSGYGYGYGWLVLPVARPA